jgi:hypothetical protein
VRRDRALRQSASARTAHTLGVISPCTYALESERVPRPGLIPDAGCLARTHRSQRSSRAVIAWCSAVALPSNARTAMVARSLKRSWLFAALTPIAVAGVVYATVQARLAGDRPPLAEYRIHLGMTPADVRATFAAPTAEGSRWRVDSSGETALEWRGGNRSFRFEFHNAQLVAVRAIVESRDPSTHGRALEVSTAAVLRRVVREDGRVELTLVARDCPSHAEEAQRLMSGR